ncbi:MAG: hypothetical protein EXX96DRAFT_613344 [Benjaminiella poitrasii]|nr:MAG: hypothetical protein EXX96DRAFT_613344 [Benjaminiella poitrasii]
MKFFTIISCLGFLFLEQVIAKPAEGCLQNHTIIDTDSCTSVAAQFNLTEASFYAMNPGLHHSVNHDCDNLDTGKPYCVCMTEPCVAGVSNVVSNQTVTAVNATAVTNTTTSILAETSVSPSSSSMVPLIPTLKNNSVINSPSITSQLASSSAVTNSSRNSSSPLAKTVSALAFGLAISVTFILV